VPEIHFAQETWHVAHWHQATKFVASEREFDKITADGNCLVTAGVSGNKKNFNATN
jgi:hypothetical protein